MKRFLRYISVGVVVLVVGGFVVADTVNQEVGILLDGDMEMVGVASWTLIVRVDGTKESGHVIDGDSVLRLTYNDAVSLNGAMIQEAILVPYKSYRITGWARSDGTVLPDCGSGSDGTKFWTGTAAHTDWQYFDVTGSPDADNRFSIGMHGATAIGTWVEFDDIMVTEYTPPIVNNEETVANWDDGDMEDTDGDGVGEWTVTGGATLTKETGAVDDGSQILRVRGASWCGAVQYPLTSGNTYRVTGWVRGDGGTGRGTVGGINPPFYGEASDDWQYFDIKGEAVSTSVVLYQIGAGGNDYVEFDNIFVTEYTPPMFNDNVQELADGDMEDADGDPVSEWTSGNSATLTKLAGWVDDGSQVLRIARNGVADPRAQQAGVFTNGKTYRITGWVRSDGNATPKVYNGGASMTWTGVNTHTNWQRFDETFAHISGDSQLYLQGLTSVGTEHVEFDDVFITLTEPQYNHYGQLLVDGDMEVAETLGAELLTDGDMELAGTANWPAVESTITKSTVLPHDGVQSLRVTADSVAGARIPRTFQTILAISTRYRVTGYARSDGTELPKIFSASSSPAPTIWTGTNSSSYQYFDETFTAGAATIQLRFNITDPAGTEWAEFDDVSVKEITNDGCDAWAPANSAILSKESADPHSGSLSLRITHDGAENPYVQQVIHDVGTEYRATGWARSDGTAIPRYSDSGLNTWSGTDSTSWQYFDVTYTAAAVGSRLYAVTAIAGYVEFDGVVVTRTD